MRFFWDTAAGFVVVSLGNGDLLMESLRDVARQADIHTGVLTSGIGSLTKARIHTVITNDYPPENAYFDLDGPLEVVQFGGIIADYEPHIHISLWDKDRQYWGGHLEDGCAVLTLSEISIRVLPELRLTRRANEQGIYLLDEVRT